ncbi:MAG: transglutaminase domain-containing protein [Planctomycetaceae bacterium]|nr:transglutaminase domain-containing protein [Planctomycetaceae bacterium]
MRRTQRGVGLGPLVLGIVLLLGVVAPTPAQESWDAVYMAGAKVGHIHTYVQPVTDRGRDLVRVRVDMVLSFKRLNDRVRIEMRYGTIETPDGSVLRLDTRTLASDQELRTFGDVINNKMTLTLEGSGQRQQSTISWGPEVRGPYAAEQSLSRQPMKPGESRSLRMFVPELSKICDVTLTAKAFEEVQLGAGVKRSLLRVENVVMLDGKPRPEYDSTLWVDSGGQVLKSQSDVLGGMVTFRTTREAATAPDGEFKLNLILASIIKVTHKIPRPEATRDIVYHLSLKSDDPSKLVPSDRRQALRPGPDPNTSILEVKSLGAADGTSEPGQVDEQFLRPNSLVTSEDPIVRSLADKAVGDAVDPWEKAVKIEHWVAQNLKDKNFKTAFAPASEVARNLSGDCTEHGVLVAAMCRAAGVPARVAVGLVYADHLGGFGFHLWNEVYVNQRWVAIDAAFDQSTVDAVHIKLGDTSLDGVSPYEAFLPVVRVLGKMTLEPLEIR